jgi:hypothetical protein
MDDKQERRSNPADAPRPLPLNNIKSPTAESEGPGLQRIDPAKAGRLAEIEQQQDAAALSHARGLSRRR